MNQAESFSHRVTDFGRLQYLTIGRFRRKQLFATDRFRPILLKKSTMVSAVEKYASEIEIFTFSRGFQTQISRSSV
jgi:hypothetical protein